MGFFQLVDDVVIGVLSQWIGAGSLAKLDSACCNQIERISLLQLLAASHFTTIQDRFHIYVDGLLNWCILRQVKLRSLWFGRIKFAQFDITKLNLRYLAVIYLKSDLTQTKDETQLVEIVNRCHNLDEMHLTSFRSNFQFTLVSQFNSDILNRIKVLHCSDCWRFNEMSLDTVLHLTAHCHGLMDIELQCVSGDAVTSLSQLICNNSQTLQRISLRFFMVSASDQVITAALQCPNLTKFEMRRCLSCVSSFSEATKFVRVNPSSH